MVPLTTAVVDVPLLGPQGVAAGVVDEFELKVVLSPASVLI